MVHFWMYQHTTLFLVFHDLLLFTDAKFSTQIVAILSYTPQKHSKEHQQTQWQHSLSPHIRTLIEHKKNKSQSLPTLHADKYDKEN